MRRQHEWKVVSRGASLADWLRVNSVLTTALRVLSSPARAMPPVRWQPYGRRRDLLL